MTALNNSSYPHRHLVEVLKGKFRSNIPRKGFTLIELLVVISIIALLLSILVPSLNRVKNQAKSVVCQGRLKQWGLAWSMYLEENDRHFPHYLGYSWMKKLKNYYADNETLLYCPMTSRTRTEGAPVRYAVIEDELGNRYGSYALNQWVYDEDGRDNSNYWRHAENTNLNNIPVMADASWKSDAKPYATDQPPEYEEEPVTEGGSGGDEMSIFCINRHDGAVNVLFMDWSVRRVGLKELWSLKWHRSYNTALAPYDWPDWMKGL